MMVFNFKSVLLLFFIIDKILGDHTESLFTTTDYTLSSFKHSNYTCPNEQCDFLMLWCKDDVNEKCININMDDYDAYNEKLLNKKIKTEPKPILTTCNIASVNEKKCKTPKCSKNEDCYSGSCYNNNCVADKDIYYCESSLNNVYCKKQIYMPCKEENECLSLICINETCQPEDYFDNEYMDNVKRYVCYGLL
eukprot:jgi/Orpsp1_1/1175758/evm.model.c7180000055103.1